MKFINDTELFSSLIIVNMNLPASSSLDQQPKETTESTFIMSAEDNKLDDRLINLAAVVTHGNLGRLEKCAERNLVKFSKDNAESCTWEGRGPGNETALALPAWGAALWKGPGHPDGEQSAHVLAVCPGTKGSHHHPGLYEQEHDV